MVKSDVTNLQRLMILFNLHLGLRAAELSALRWCDVSLEKHMLYVRGQLNSEHERLDHTKKYTPEGMRDIPLTKDAEKAFRLIIMLKGFEHSGDELIFPADGYRSYLRRCKDAFAYACECDVEDLGEHYVTHTLRATTATVLYNSDVPPKLIQKILGHKSLAMTMRYCHDFTDQDELRDYMQEALDRQKFVV